jgi:hypothetical protein
MVQWDLAGVHGINKYIWQQLQDELEWAAYNVTTAQPLGLTPITTPQQQPEFNALQKPYIVYSYTKVGSDDLYVLETETAAYTVYSTLEKDVRQVVNLLTAKLGRLDDSASDVNAYLSTVPGVSKEFDYKYISITSAQGPQPSASEGGRMDGLVVIRYAYTHYGPGISTGVDVNGEPVYPNDSIRY